MPAPAFLKMAENKIASQFWHTIHFHQSKKLHPTDPEMTPPPLLLCCVQLGISVRDLDLLTIGMVNDMYAESRNDDYNYATVATQNDMDAF